MNPDQLQLDRVLQEVFTPARASSSAVAHKPHVQAQGLVKSIRVQIAIYRSTGLGSVSRPSEQKRCCTLNVQPAHGRPVESERCWALEHVEATKFLVGKELFLLLNF